MKREEFVMAMRNLGFKVGKRNLATKRIGRIAIEVLEEGAYADLFDQQNPNPNRFHIRVYEIANPYGSHPCYVDVSTRVYKSPAILSRAVVNAIVKSFKDIAREVEDLQALQKNIAETMGFQYIK